MAINLTGLFTDLGKIFHVPYILAGAQSALNTAIQTVIDDLKSDSVTPEYAGLVQSQKGSVAAAVNPVGPVVSMAAPTLLKFVQADNPTITSVPGALQYLAQYMQFNSKTIQACTIGCTVTNWPSYTNIGNGVVSVDTKRGDGLIQQNSIADSMWLRCVADSYTGGATAGQEQFTLLGKPQTAQSLWNYDFPTGSGSSVSCNAIPATQEQQASGNILNNGSFGTWTSPTAAPTGWASAVGTWGTNLNQYTASPYEGLYAVQFVAGTGLNLDVKQQLGNAAGTTVQPDELVSYHVAFALKRLGVVTAGVLTIELVDGSGTVINDQQGTANSTTVTLSGITTSYVLHTAVFRLPAVTPSAIYLRFRLSTALTGADIVLASARMAKATATQGNLGPGFCVFSGNTNYVLNDSYAIAVTNNRGGGVGASLLATFQADLERAFGMTSSFSILLPYSGSPDYADTLITS